MKIEIVHITSIGQKTVEFNGSSHFAMAQSFEYVRINTPIHIEAIRITEEHEENESAKGFRTSSAV